MMLHFPVKIIYMTFLLNISGLESIPFLPSTLSSWTHWPPKVPSIWNHWQSILCDDEIFVVRSRCRKHWSQKWLNPPALSVRSDWHFAFNGWLSSHCSVVVNNHDASFPCEDYLHDFFVEYIRAGVNSVFALNFKLLDPLAPKGAVYLKPLAIYTLRWCNICSQERL